MNYIELKPKEVIDYFKNKPQIGMGLYGVLYEYDRDRLIKLYYRKYLKAYKSKKVRDFKSEMKINIELANFNFDFNSDKKLINLERRLENTSSKGLINAIVTNRGYRIGILEEYYKGYDILGNKIYDYTISERKYILEKVREKIFELFDAGIYPLDISEKNILLNDNKEVKIIDLDGDDVRLEEKEFILSHPNIQFEGETRLIEMEYRLLRK